MTFTQAITDGFSKYATASGRSSRSAYWWWTLFVTITIVVVYAVCIAIDNYILYGLTALGLVIPGVAVAIRRLHDIGRSGWWWLIGVVPIIGWILQIVWAATPSQGPNKYGQGPDQASGQTVAAV